MYMSAVWSVLSDQWYGLSVPGFLMFHMANFSLQAERKAAADRGFGWPPLRSACARRYLIVQRFKSVWIDFKNVALSPALVVANGVERGALVPEPQVVGLAP